MRVHLARILFEHRSTAIMKLRLGADNGTAAFLEHVEGIFAGMVFGKPYASSNDPRFEVIQGHLQWFRDWELDVKKNTVGLTKADANKFFLAFQTWQNLQTTVNGWMAAVRGNTNKPSHTHVFYVAFLDEHPGYHFFGKRMTQSCLEALFARIRQMGGGGKNPLLVMYRSALAAIRVLGDCKFHVRNANVSGEDLGLDISDSFFHRFDRRSEQTLPPLVPVQPNNSISEQARRVLRLKVKLLLKQLFDVKIHRHTMSLQGF